MSLSLGEMGLLLSAFSWSYALAQLPVGAMVDRLGPRRLLGLGLVFWSLAQAAGGLVTSFTQFILTRIGLGLGEAPQFRRRRGVVSNWFPVSKRGLPREFSIRPRRLALHCTAAAQPIADRARLAMGVLITGAAGLIMAVLWFALYRDPKTMNFLRQSAAISPPKRRKNRKGNARRLGGAVFL